MTELELRDPHAGAIVDVSTGELIDPSDIAAVAACLKRLREFELVIVLGEFAACEEALIEEMTRLGRKTLRVGGLEARQSGGSETVWDAQKLERGLRKAGLPEERLNELVKMEVTYKVDGAVARQLAGANPKYERVIKRSKSKVEKKVYVSVKRA
jgi:hypothetical protein